MMMARGFIARSAVAAVSLSALAAAGTAEERGVSAVQKVVQMLQDMSGKARKEKNAEVVAFSSFTQWCSSETANMQEDVQKGAAEIDSLTASVGKLDSDITAHGAHIQELQADTTKFDAEAKATTAQREKDRADFQATEKDFSESVDAIERALAFLNKQNFDRAGAGAALLQASEMQQLPEQARSLVGAFIGMMDEDKDADRQQYSPPKANAYEFQSGGIIDMLKKLRDDFRDKLTDCQKEEMNSKHASEMILLSLTDSSENAARETEDTSMLLQDKTVKKAVDEKQLRGAIAVKADNEKTLSEVKTECSEKKFSFEEKQQLRGEEIEAIGKAIEIMQSPEVLGKELGLAQAKSRTALVQLVNDQSSWLVNDQTSSSSGIHFKLFDFLASEGRRLHSDSLSMLAQKAMSNPFAKVRSMIEALITRLHEEANQDANHEAFCDKELGTNKKTRNHLTANIDQITARMEDAKATIMSLAEESAQLSKEIAGLDQATAEATEMRTTESKANAETIQDSKAAQNAVAAATSVLEEFYAKAGTATALIQVSGPKREWAAKSSVKMGTDEWDALANPSFKGEVDKGHKEGMQTFGDNYQGQSEETNGVLALLEVISSDFARLEAETSAAESAAEQAYSRFMAESKISKATKSRKVEMNTSDKVSFEAKFESSTSDLKATKQQLVAADRYYEKLVPQCIDSGMSWDERVSARKAEIQSLKEALKILEGADIA